jgi:DNA polymerase III subunit gamma/tau
VPGASPQLAQLLTRRLQEWTGSRWMVVVSNQKGAPSLKEQADAAAESAAVGVRADPLVRRVLDYFPGAQIVAVRTTEIAMPPSSTNSVTTDDEIAYTDSDTEFTEDDL